MIQTNATHAYISGIFPQGLAAYLNGRLRCRRRRERALLALKRCATHAASVAPDNEWDRQTGEVEEEKYHVTCRTSNTIRRTSHVTRHTPHATRHLRPNLRSLGGGDGKLVDLMPTTRVISITRAVAAADDYNTGGGGGRTISDPPLPAACHVTPAQSPQQSSP